MSCGIDSAARVASVVLSHVTPPAWPVLLLCTMCAMKTPYNEVRHGGLSHLHPEQYIYGSFQSQTFRYDPFKPSQYMQRKNQPGH